MVVDSVRGDSGLVLRVQTSDGWSTRPDYRFKSTGGQADYTIAFIEDNLLGTARSKSNFLSPPHHPMKASEDFA